MQWKGRLLVVLFFLLWAELSPAIHKNTTVLRHVSCVLPGGVGDGAYHGVPQNENGQLGVLFLHEINVLQAVPDEDVEIWDNHTITLALPMTNCRGKEEHASKSFEAVVAVEKSLAETCLLDSYCPNLTFSCSHLSTERVLQKYKGSCAQNNLKSTILSMIWLKKIYIYIPLCFSLLFKTKSTDLISCSLQHQGKEGSRTVLPCCRDGRSLHPGKWGFAPGTIAAGVWWLTVLSQLLCRSGQETGKFGRLDMVAINLMGNGHSLFQSLGVHELCRVLPFLAVTLEHWVGWKPLLRGEVPSAEEETKWRWLQQPSVGKCRVACSSWTSITANGTAPGRC